MTGREEGDVDVPEQLILRVGQSKALRLPGLGTAGYRWESLVGSDVVEAQWHRGFEGSGGSQAAPGVSAPETVTLTGLRVGTTTVELVQARPWESPDAALQRRRITVTVVE